MSALRSTAPLALLLALAGPVAAGAPGGCIDFAWDVRAEHLLFAMTPALLAAGTDRASMPMVTVDRLYQLHLQPHSAVSYAVPPGAREMRPEGFGGIVSLQVSVPGIYRISADQPLWVDVAFNGALLKPVDFQGRRDCTNPQKIVEFELPMGVNLTVQLSNASGAEARIAVTPATEKAR